MSGGGKSLHGKDYLKLAAVIGGAAAMPQLLPLLGAGAGTAAAAGAADTSAAGLDAALNAANMAEDSSGAAPTAFPPGMSAYQPSGGLLAASKEAKTGLSNPFLPKLMAGLASMAPQPVVAQPMQPPHAGAPQAQAPMPYGQPMAQPQTPGLLGIDPNDPRRQQYLMGGGYYG